MCLVMVFNTLEHHSITYLITEHLFIIFMNDLPLHMYSSLDMYVDDSTLIDIVEDLEYKWGPDMRVIDD